MVPAAKNRAGRERTAAHVIADVAKNPKAYGWIGGGSIVAAILTFLVEARDDFQMVASSLQNVSVQASKNTDKLASIETNLAVYTGRLGDLTAAIKAAREDHDIVIEMRTEMRAMKATLARIESDVHELKKK